MKKLTIENSAEILEEINKAKKILMHCHPNADGDSLGSVLGMYHLLKPLNKDITIIGGDTPIPKFLSFLTGYEKIIQKNYFEINPADFDLFLILDTSALGHISTKGTVVFPSTLKTINIDHHASNKGFTDIAIIESSYPATGQILYELIKIWGLPLNHDCALCLLIGIYTDTFGFMYKGTTKKTFEAAADLVEYAPNFTDEIFKLYNNNSAGRILLQGILLSSLETMFSNSIVVGSISLQELESKNISIEETGGVGGDVANIFKSVIGWNIGITLIESNQGIVKLSFRSRDPATFDVSKVASILGGGGHRAAAGAVIKEDIPKAKEILKKALKEAYSFLEE